MFLALRAWPDWRTCSNLETAFMDVRHRVGGAPLFQVMSVVMLIAMLGSGLAGAQGSAHLLYGMGRDGVLSRGVFSRLSHPTGTSTYAIFIVGPLAPDLIIGPNLVCQPKSPNNGND